MARTKQSALKRSGSSSRLPEDRPTKMQRSSEKDANVKLEPGLNNTAQQGAVTIKLEAGVEESGTLVKVKLEPKDVHQGRGVRVKPDPDAVSSSLLQQQHHRAANNLEAQEQPVQPRRRGSAAAATAAAAAVKSEDAKPEHIGYPYGAAAAAAAAAVQPKHWEVQSDPEAGHDAYDDEDEDYDEEYDDASDDVDDDPDMGCDCAACMGIDDMYDYDEYGDDMGCGCPHCLALAVSDDSDQYSEISDSDGEDADGSELPVWTWGKHAGTPIKDTPGGYIHWLCREPHYFEGSDWKIRLLRQLIAARRVKIVNGVEAESPAVHVIPLVRNDDEDYGYWGYSACGCGCC